MALVSIVVPCFNCEKWVTDAITSATLQSLKDIEILCIDDKSTDSTGLILEKLKQKDQRIKIITLQENKGVSNARNIGIIDSTGDYIFFLDPDDKIYDKQALEKLYKACQLNEQNLSGGSLIQYNEKTKKIENDFTGRYKNFKIIKDGWISLKEYQFCLGFYRFLFKKNFLVKNKIFFPPLSRFQDAPFLLKALILNGGFYGLNLKVYFYRVKHKDLKNTPVKFLDSLEGHLEVSRLAHANNLEQLYRDTICDIGINIIKHYPNFFLRILNRTLSKILKCLTPY